MTNAAFVLGLTAGRLLSGDTFGPDVTDGDGSIHKHLTNIGHFVREAGQSKLQSLRSEFMQIEGATVVDYTEDAAPANYDEYASNLAGHKGEQILYRAIWVYGPAEIVLPKTKNLSRFQ